MRYLLVIMLMLLAVPRVSIDVMPRVVMKGDSIRLRCRVPRHPDNRGLTMMLGDGTRSSFVQLDGEDARVFHERIFERVTCFDERVTCTVHDDRDRTFLASTPLIVAGCSP